VPARTKSICTHALCARLPLTVRFQAMDLATHYKSCISALSLERHCVVSERMSWRVERKPMEAIADRKKVCRLAGSVVADDAFLAGLCAGKPRSEHKVPFAGVAELDEQGHPHHLRIVNPEGLSSLAAAGSAVGRRPAASSRRRADSAISKPFAGSLLRNRISRRPSVAPTAISAFENTPAVTWRNPSPGSVGASTYPPWWGVSCTPARQAIPAAWTGIWPARSAASATPRRSRGPRSPP
jgi:hypothetical protein